MSHSKKAPDGDPGWKKAANRINAMNGLPPKQPMQSQEPSSQDPTEEELLAEEELEGERIRQAFQAEINASSKRKQYDENPIKLLIATYPALSSYDGTGMSRTFSRNIESCLGDNRLNAIYSRNQLIALAAAKTLAPVLDWPPGKLHQLHAVCCRIAKTHMSEKGAQIQ